jgi:hypothetical protein
MDLSLWNFSAELKRRLLSKQITKQGSYESEERVVQFQTGAMIPSVSMLLSP